MLACKLPKRRAIKNCEYANQNHNEIVFYTQGELKYKLEAPHSLVGFKSCKHFGKQLGSYS